jgi:RNA polymerase sigma-70 factor (ECF subfamily)
MVKGPNDLPIGPAPAGAGGSTVSPSLLLRVRAGDPAAWQRLLQLYGPFVYALGRRQGLQPEDAADVVQEVFLAVARGLADFRREHPGDSFRGWLRVITGHKLADFWRRRSRRPQAEGGSEAQRRLEQLPQPDSAPSTNGADGHNTRLLLQRALELIRPGFSARTWQAFCGVALDGRPAADVAAELGLSVNAVYIARSRVLGRLRAEFGEVLD